MNSKLSAGRDVAAIVLGNALTAWAYSWILVKAGVISGGVTASAMIMARLTSGSVTAWSNGITATCLVIALMFLGRRNFINSLIASLSYMGWFTLAQAWQPANGLPLWLGLPLAGIMVGVGYELCIGHHASTAGLDVLALVLHRYRPTLPVARSLRVINVTILALGAWQFGWQSFLWGLGFILIYTQTLAGLTRRRQLVKV
ncbi:YitT family protein [Lactiplantibacillus carotarum]|uniref:YitT family protein n=1 Tax=Lactiplantibacillus carotarum TaxID=2993456 RepID=UPI00298EE6E0|nr:YitT family protein [Lactiplantibacillus carotarum]